jgi:hypothetical protein
VFVKRSGKDWEVRRESCAAVKHQFCFSRRLSKVFYWLLWRFGFLLFQSLNFVVEFPSARGVTMGKLFIGQQFLEHSVVQKYHSLPYRQSRSMNIGFRFHHKGEM